MQNLKIESQNPYVGPRTFRADQRDLFFGREREARDLLDLVIANREVLFFAQSGAGKSSLINTRLIPDLKERDFEVLPVARVGGDLRPRPEVANIYAYNLMLDLESTNQDEHRFTDMALSDFLTSLNCVDGQWVYRATQSNEESLTTAEPLWQPNDPSEDDYLIPPRVLIIDQFEELLTTYPAAWEERADFFQQLSAAQEDDPYLWIVFSIREDYIAGLAPYIHFMADGLRTRYYMQRMGVPAALDAIREPAALHGRTFGPDVAETLVDNLRQIRAQGSISGNIPGNIQEDIQGQNSTQLGQFIEPVQLQVVCYQLWESLQGRPIDQIELTDVQESGDVDDALENFYETAITEVLAELPPGVQVSERQLREWFTTHLLTKAGTRSTVYQGETESEGLSNDVVRLLQDRFLIRSENRAGGNWLELVHDRFVAPIQQSNRLWLAEYDNPVTRAYQRWLAGGQTDSQLLQGQNLSESETFSLHHPNEVTADELDFLQRSQQRATRLREEEQRSMRRQRWILFTTIGLMLLFAGLASWALIERANAQRNADLAAQQKQRQLYEEAQELKEQGDTEEAIAILQDIADGSALGFYLEDEIADVLRVAAAKLVREGEELANIGEPVAAGEKFQAALDLEPPLDTPLYVWIPPGEFTIGTSDDAELVYGNETPQHPVTLPGFWIMRSEVTNIQYTRCFQEDACGKPHIQYYDGDVLANYPANNMDWHGANRYAVWVGGRLPTEVEWEAACRGTDMRRYPWGNEEPNPSLLNYNGAATSARVDEYPEGASPYGLLNMAGNVWEWTSSKLDPYPYQRYDGREDFTWYGNRIFRGGSYINGGDYVHCAGRTDKDSRSWFATVGLRIVSLSRVDYLFREGDGRVQEDQIDEAIALFEEALTLDPLFEGDVQVEAKRRTAHMLIQKGVGLAQDVNRNDTALALVDQIDTVLALMDQAELVYPDLEPKSREVALATVQDVFADDGLRYLRENRIQEAITVYKVMVLLDPSPETLTDMWNHICWFGSLHGRAKEVGSACERAVLSAPHDSNIRDTRGLMRALTGDFEGAIEDFQVYYDENFRSWDQVRRKDWIDMLERGENPFDATLLRDLFYGE